MSASDKKTIYAIIEQLNRMKASSGDEGAIATAIESLSNTFGVSLENASDKENLSIGAKSLASIVEGIPTIGETIATAKADNRFQKYLNNLTQKGAFQKYEEGSPGYIALMGTIASKFLEKYAPQPVEDDSDEEDEVTYSDEDLKKAEDLKASGNDLLKAKKYQEAVDLYTQAIETVPKGPNSHIYYSNRAAAYSFLKDYELALPDCKKSIELEPSYVKSYSRAGQAYFNLEEYENAVEMYSKCVELDPMTQTHKDSLERAQRKVDGGSSMANMGGMDGMDDLASMMQGAGGLEGLGGLGGLMNNPNFKNQAQKNDERSKDDGNGKKYDAKSTNDAKYDGNAWWYGRRRRRYASNGRRWWWTT